MLLRVLAGLDLSVLRPRSAVYVHLHKGVLAGLPGVARVEGMGPQRIHLSRAGGPVPARDVEES